MSYLFSLSNHFMCHYRCFCIFFALLVTIVQNALMLYLTYQDRLLLLPIKKWWVNTVLLQYQIGVATALRLAVIFVPVTAVWNPGFVIVPFSAINQWFGLVNIHHSRSNMMRKLNFIFPIIPAGNSPLGAVPAGDVFPGVFTPRRTGWTASGL